MRKALQEELFAIAPECFVRDSPQTSLMCFGFEVGDGWYGLLRHGLERIAFYLNDTSTPPRFEVCQVKEKFGTLRFYTYGGNDHIERIVDGMEFASACICEFCGASGTTRYELSWNHTLCDACLDDYNHGRRVYSEWEGKGGTG